MAALAQAAYRPHESSTPTVAGNIHHPRYRAFWESLNADSYVMSIIRSGYKLPFKEGSTPTSPYREKNNKTALQNMPFCQDHVEGLLVDRVVSEVFKPPLCVSPLTVASRYVFPDSTRRGYSGNGDTTTVSRCTNFDTFKLGRNDRRDTVVVSLGDFR